MARIPRDPSFDRRAPCCFLRGYEFISNRCRRYGTDLFATRIMLKKVVCMQGAEAAEHTHARSPEQPFRHDKSTAAATMRR
jgi:fatty-acid peroxygenase